MRRIFYINCQIVDLHLRLIRLLRLFAKGVDPRDLKSTSFDQEVMTATPGQGNAQILGQSKMQINIHPIEPKYRVGQSSTNLTIRFRKSKPVEIYAGTFFSRMRRLKIRVM